MPSLNAGAEDTAAEAAFTAAVVAEDSTAVAEDPTAVAGAGSTAAVVARFVEAGSAGVDAHSAVAGGRTADRMAARIAGVEPIAEGDSHRAALAVPGIEAVDSARALLEDSHRAAPGSAADHCLARTVAVSTALAASAVQADSEPAMPSRTAGGIRLATAAVL
ncbi:MAG: hypothetical protein WA434_10890 [Candidatus Acidiferrales bacterium]